MDFGSIPPEINSARIYAGPGSAPLLAAAASWDKLAAELGSAAAGYQAAINSLVSEDWTGPAANSMAAAATPYVGWMTGAAAKAEQTAAQAKAAAAAYEAARAASVAPPVVVANRSQLALLVATNFLGLNASAIAATEAQYAQMWAQDAAAMYGYAAASAAASQVAPFSAPKQTTNPAGQANQDAAVGQAAGNAATSNAQQTLSQTMTQITGNLQQLSSPLQSGSGSQGGLTLPDFLNPGDLQPGDVLNTVSNMMSSSFSPMGAGAIIQTMADLAVVRGAALAAADPLGLGAVDPLDMLMPQLGLGAGMAGLPGLGGGLGSIGTASAAMGNASMVGSLSVPASWSSALPAATPGATTAATGWTVAAHAAEGAGAPGMPGVPLGAAGRNYGGFAAPRYGFKPTVMARPVVAG